MIFTDIEKSKILLFWVQVEVEGLSCVSPSAMDLKEMFIRRAAEKYDIYLKNNLYETGGVFAVPFKDKENIRIELNVFASEMEDEYRAVHPQMEWRMQSTNI